MMYKYNFLDLYIIQRLSRTVHYSKIPRVFSIVYYILKNLSL